MREPSILPAISTADRLEPSMPSCLLLPLVAILCSWLCGCGGNAETTPRDPRKSEEHLEKARAHLDAGKTIVAAKELEKAVRADPGNAEAQYQLGRCYLPLARGSRALECFESAIEAEPDHVGALIEAGRMRCRLREFEKGLPLLQRAVELEPENHVSRFHLGAALLDSGRLEPAREHLEKAVALYPDFSGAWFHLGKLHLEADEPEAALTAFERCLELHPTHVGALHQAARIEERAGDGESAEHRRQLLRLVTEIEQLGRRSRLGAEEELRVALQEALRFDPRNHELQLWLGDWHRDHGDPETALQLYESAQQLAPERPQPYRRLALLYRKLGREQLARAAAARYQQLFREDPQD